MKLIIKNMKTKKIIGGLCVLSILAFAYIAMPGLLSIKNKQTRIEKDENESFNDAAKYLFSMRVNPETGTISQSEVDAARQQVDAMSSANSTERMKSGAFNLHWQELGPNNVGGRTRAILFDKVNPDKMFAGGVSGGLWKSLNHGQSWNLINDSLQNLCVSCICQAQNGDIYFGTGNGFDVIIGDGNSGFYGQGVWKSTDGGNSFKRLDSTWTTATQQGVWNIVNNIYADPTNPNRIYAATNKGLRMTNDGGINWVNPVRYNMTGAQINLTAQTVKVATDGTVVCCVNNNLYISPNGNDNTFTRITSIPVQSRVEVAISPSNSNVMYAVVISGSSSLYNVYRSTDRFQTATVIGPGGGSFDPYTEATSNQGWYDCAVAVAPNNPDKVFVVGITAWMWQINHNWTQMNGYMPTNYIHPDMHTIQFCPNNPNDFFIGTDGGLFESTDQGVTFAAMNRGYNVTQFYTVSHSYVQGSPDIIGGTQDNGCLYIDGLINTNQTAHSIHGGDGFYTSTSYYNPMAFFVESQYGGMARTSNKGTSSEAFYDNHIDPNLGTGSDHMGVDANFSPFNTAFLLWENLNPNAPTDTSFFIGIQGGVWMTKKALDFSTGPKWYKVANTQSPARCLGVTNDGKTLFVGTEGTNYVYRVSNLDYVNNNLDTSGTNSNLTTGTSIVNYNLPGLPTSMVPTSISVDPMHNNHVVVTYGNYTSTGVKHVMVSHNALNPIPTWTDVTHNIPNMPVYSSVIDRWDSARIVVGTELGVFASNDGGAIWTYQDEFPRVPTFMLKEIPVYTNGTPAADIYAGTHGRGFWGTSSLTGITNNPSYKPQVSVYPNPTQEVANINYTITKSATVLLDIYNLQGKKVKALNLGVQSSGLHNYSVNVAELATGTYFMTTTIDGEKASTKFIIAR